MVTPAALVIAPPARLIGLLPKNSAGRTQFSRNRCVIVSPWTKETRFIQTARVRNPFRTTRYEAGQLLRLLQRTEVNNYILDLLVCQLAGKCLHLPFAVLHRVDLLFLAGFVFRCRLHCHHLGNTRTRCTRAAVTALAIRLV